MTLPPLIRIFFAIDLPLSAKETLGQFISMLKKKSKSNFIRWTKAENLHITLQFLGEIQTILLPQLIDQVKKELMIAKIKSSTLTLGALELFPHPYHPRVIVLNVTGQDYLAHLSKIIGKGIQTLNYDIDPRPFRGHLTLGRIKQPQAINLNFLSECSLPTLKTISFKEVILFRSESQPIGSKYTILEKITLG